MYPLTNSYRGRLCRYLTRRITQTQCHFSDGISSVIPLCQRWFVGKAGCAEKRVAVLGWQSIEPARDTKSASQTPGTELSNNPTPTRRQYLPAQTGRQYRWAKVATEGKPTPSNPKHNESQRCCCRLLATRLKAWPVGCAARSKHLGSMELQ